MTASDRQLMRDLAHAIFSDTRERPEKLRARFQSWQQAQPPAARFRRGKLLCSHRRINGPEEAVTPHLIEAGMVITHDLIAVRPKAKYLDARGWDGDTCSISEEGEELLLECPECQSQYLIPDGCEIEWQERE
jgi:hypothetical protein